MSSQGMNATTQDGVFYTPTPRSYYFPPRDASDVTRILKERLIQGENRPTSNTVQPGNPLPIWIKNGNQFRLSYLFGKSQCGDCSTRFPSGQVVGKLPAN